MFGALALGDIGTHFPDTDEAYKDISSLILLKHAVKLVLDEGYTINNIDCNIIAQAPKMKLWMVYRFLHMKGTVHI